MVLEPLKSMLDGAGWSAGRSIDPASAIQRLQQLRYATHRAASEVVAEFGGLTLVIRQIVSSKGDVVTPMIPATVHVIDDCERFRLPPWTNLIRGEELADRRLLKPPIGDHAMVITLGLWPTRGRNRTVAMTVLASELTHGHGI
jgi:hypothetical protein